MDTSGSGGQPNIVIYERSNFLVRYGSLFRPSATKFKKFTCSQIGHSIGQGSFAMVYKGKDRMTGREVAMKIVRSQDQIEFDDGSGGCPDDAYRCTVTQYFRFLGCSVMSVTLSYQTAPHHLLFPF